MAQDFDFIETPENVELEQRLAGIGSRFIAGFVDTMLVILGVLVLVFSVMLATDALDVNDIWTADNWAWVIFAVGVFVLHWGYFFLFEFFRNGQTPGKKHMQIRVVKEGGGPLTFVDAAIRNLLRPIDGFPLYPIAGVCMFVSRKVQRLGDLAAGTVVVSETPLDYSAKSDRRRAMDWAAQETAADLRRTALTPEEFRLLSSYQLRRQELTIDARLRVLDKLLPPVLARLGRPSPGISIEAMEAEVDLLLGGAQVRPVPEEAS
ncbi:MAG: hypothetical protein AMXMBFR13_16810 [Phycisphaerae bacterium]